MSEPQLISPLLDGFVMGDPISNHDGVRACPAMQLETDTKYIVKLISLPANQSKLDALLLAGAFSDQESALAYFKELADGVVEEAVLLQKLARSEGFVSFDSWQMLPMEEGETGFDIYLLGQYRPTLEGVLRNNEMTHLQAVNLGLDLCAALSASRRSGYLYCNLKPSNIYICNEREFRIGDLGFLSLDSLQYASLPDKYHSDYTPAEINDAYSALNSTMDTYAVGLILYQAYNDGKLPPVGISLEAPPHADAALSEIILKACAVDPAERWLDPVQMGQALVNYLQSNTVNDTPIVPPIEQTETEEIFPDEDTQPLTEDILAEVDEALDAAPPIVAVPAAEEEQQEIVEETVEEISEEAVEPAEEMDDNEAVAPEAEESEEESEVTETTEETAEEAPQEEVVEDETAQMLAQADDLIAHQLPDPPVAPDPIEVKLPEPEEVVQEIPEEETDSPDEDAEELSEEADHAESEEDADADTEDENNECQEDIPQPKKRRKGLIVTAIVLATLLLLGALVILYQNVYLQKIDDMTLLADEDRLSVTLTTEMDTGKLSILCTDTHGNSLTAPVENGVANFTGLKPGTSYTLEVRVDGFHKLIGKTSASFTTVSQTVINGFYAATGPENGSVILSFTIQGPDSPQWKVTYSAEGEESQIVTFAGHMATLQGLTVGKEYTFKLEPANVLYVSGNDLVTHTVSNIIYAENLQVLGFRDGKLGIKWTAPDGVTIPKWYVRCYNDAGFDKTLSCADTTIDFEGLEQGVSSTIEVTAEGMPLGTRFYLSANAAAIDNLKIESIDGNNLQVSWTTEVAIPEGGWLLTYTVDGAEQKQIACPGNSATITPLIPGAHYSITIQAADGTTALGGNLEYDTPKANDYNKYQVTNKNMEFSMCKTPKKNGWTHKHVPSSDYTTSFKVGTRASFVMHLNKKTTKTDAMVVTLYVIRDAEGKLISANSESRTWDDMWDERYGELTIPAMPEKAGQYTVEIYFDGAFATIQNFTITSE